MSERNLDSEGRFRNRTVAFRMSDAEADRLNQLVAISGLTKQDYITQCLLERKVVVKPSFRVYQKVHREVFKLYDELERLESLDGTDSGLRQLLNMLLDELAGFRGSEPHAVSSGGLPNTEKSDHQKEGDAPVRQDSRVPAADSAAKSIIGRFLRRDGGTAKGAEDGR